MDARGDARVEQGDQDQLVGGFPGRSIQCILSIIQILVSLLQVRYQNSKSSPFETHQIIVSFFIGVICFYFLALMELFRPIPNANAIYHNVVGLIYYISGILACTCLILMIFPAFGWAILFLFTIKILLDPHIIELLNGIPTILFNIYDSIQQYFNISNNLEEAPTVNGNVSIEQDEGGGEQLEI